MVAKTRKPSTGRQKIAIKKIESEEARQVCFSKRRAGLFKKANELSILCGAELAILVFSPGGKPYSFSHPSLNLIADRFLHGHDDHHQAAKQTIADQQRAANVLKDLSSRHEGCLQILEVERKRKAELENFLKSAFFDNESLDKMDFGSLEVMESKLFSMKVEFEKMLINRSRAYHEQQQLCVYGNMMGNYGYNRGQDLLLALPNDVMGNYGYNRGHDLLMALPNDVMGNYGVPNCFPTRNVL